MNLLHRVYIAGPMRGIPEFNYPAFNSLEQWIDERGLPGVHRGLAYAVNPAANFGGDTGRAYAEYMRADLKLLADCQAICLLPGWEDSEGAGLEVEIARHLGIDFYAAEPLAGSWGIAQIEAPEREGRPIPKLDALMSAYGVNPAEARIAEAIERLEGKSDDGRTTTFSSGATRDTSVGKLDYEGFLSPLVLERYAEYMDKNRLQSNGTYRDSDNWQAGFTRASYQKSLWRHFMDAWKAHRGIEIKVSHEEALCAVIFNASGYLFELLQDRNL